MTLTTMTAVSETTHVAITCDCVTAIEENVGFGVTSKDLGHGEVELPCLFSRRPFRSFWKLSFPEPLDLRGARAVSFDLRCDDPRQFNAFALFPQSGAGYYKRCFGVPPKAGGCWTHVTVPLYEGDPVGAVEGFSSVPFIRLSCYRAAQGTNDVFCAVRNFQVEYQESSPVLVIRADSTFRKWGGGIMVQRTAWFASVFSRLGVGAQVRTDLDVTEEDLLRASLVVLPANGEVPERVRRWLAAYLERGGKVLACDGYDLSLASVFRLRPHVLRQLSAQDIPFGGIVLDPTLGGGFSDIFYPERRAFVTFDPTARVLAHWADGEGHPMDTPAIVASDRAIHWSLPRRRAGGGNDLAAVKAVVESFVPSLKLSLPKAASQPRLSLRDGERRLCWVHRDGVGYTCDWHRTACLAKMLGFTDILGNVGNAADAERLTAFRDACKEVGVRPHVWFETWGATVDQVGQTDADRFRRENRLQRSKDGKVLEWMCPSDPRNVSYVVEKALSLARTGVRGVHLDYVRYSSKDHCFCERCRRHFEEMLGGPCANWPQSVFAYGTREWNCWRDFRCTNISQVVRAVSAALRREANGVELSAAVFPSSAEAPYDSGQCWDVWCREGLLDFLCPMNYTSEAQLQDVWSRLEKAWALGTPVYPGIGYSGWWEPDVGCLGARLREQVHLIRESGHGGFTMYPLDEPHLPEAMGFRYNQDSAKKEEQ